MAYGKMKKRVSRKSSQTRRRSAPRFAYAHWSPSASLARKQKKYAAYKSAMGSMKELKGFDTTFGDLAIVSTTGSSDLVLPLNLVQQGAGSWNRIGRQIHNKSLKLNLLLESAFTPSGNGSFTGHTLRMAIVWDKQPDNSLPTFDDIFGVTAQDGTESSNIYAPVRYDNMSRFTVLRDKKIPVSPCMIGDTSLGTPATSVNTVIEEYLDLKNKKTVFSGQSAPMTVGDISSGALYLVLRGNVSVSSACTLKGILSQTRLRYTD